MPSDLRRSPCNSGTNPAVARLYSQLCGNCGASRIRHQAHALAIALNDQPIAVVFDFVNPFRPVRDFVPRVGMQGSKFEHVR